MGLNDITIRFKTDLKSLSTGFQNASRQTKKLGKQLQDVGRSLSISVTAPLVALGGVALNTFAQIEGVSEAFDRLNKPDLLADLRKATRGTVSDLELMTAAVQAENFKIPLDQLSTLLEFARRRAKSTGESVDFLMKSIVTGIGRKSPLILDNLGISTTRLKEALDGASTASSSIADVTEAVGKVAREELKGMGNETTTFKDSLLSLRSTMTNVGGEFGKILAKFLAPFVEKIKELADDFQELSPRTKEIIVVVAGLAAAIGPLLLVLGTMLSTLPKIVTAVKAMGSAFSAMTSPIGLAVTALVGVGLTVKGFIDLNREVDTLKEGNEALAEATKVANKEVGSQVLRVKDLVEEATKANTSEARRLEIVGELIKISPKFKEAIKGETVDLGILKATADTVTDALVKMATVKAAQGLIEELSGELINLQSNAKLAIDEMGFFEVLAASLQSSVLSFGNSTEKAMIGGQIATEKQNKAMQAVSARLEKLKSFIKANEGLFSGLFPKTVTPTIETTATGEVLPIIPQKLSADDLKGIDDQISQLAGGNFLDNLFVKSSRKLLDPELVVPQDDIDTIVSRLQLFNEEVGLILQDAAFNFLASFGEIAGAFAIGDASIKDIGNLLLSTLADIMIQLGKSAIAIGSTIEAISTALKSFFGPLAIVAGIALVALGNIIKGSSSGEKTPKLAKGGLAFGTTSAIVGDNINARTDPEVIAPLSKLKNFISPGQNIQVGGVIEIGGQKLRIVLDRADKIRRRNG